jgi:hypothetical protein
MLLYWHLGLEFMLLAARRPGAGEFQATCRSTPIR